MEMRTLALFSAVKRYRHNAPCFSCAWFFYSDSEFVGTTLLLRRFPALRRRNCMSRRLDARILEPVDFRHLCLALHQFHKRPSTLQHIRSASCPMRLQLAVLWILSVNSFTVVSGYAPPPPRCASCLSLRIPLDFPAIFAGLPTRVSPLSASVFARVSSFTCTFIIEQASGFVNNILKNLEIFSVKADCNSNPPKTAWIGSFSDRFICTQGIASSGITCGTLCSST